MRAALLLPRFQEKKKKEILLLYHSEFGTFPILIVIPLSDMIENDEETLKLLEVKIQPISSDGSHGRFYSVL